MFDSENEMERNAKLSGRRKFLFAAGGVFAGLALWHLDESGQAEAANIPKMVKIVEFSDAGERKDEVSVPMVVKSDAEWKQLLPHDSFEVTRHADTERAFTGALLNVHDKGVFRCICCDTALFSSATKFESGTGWPSFWEPIAKENVVEISDNSFGMERTAVSCRRCEAHLGHVFDDGPRPTGLRYCMNSVAMKFAKA
ncbi:MAG TPA: peptide-methionine (R)-S-oxide reductase MsrB [Candidatus Acidoferrales bacterium]